jgi:SAM-dependent methyltransferase
MRWNAQQYESWFDSPEGHVALSRESMLLEAMTAAWHRRGRRILEVGCGTGIFLESLWRKGFDVTGLDKSDSMLSGARRRLGNKASLYVGDGTHMPFDDDDFDYVVLWSVLEFCPRPQEMLEEAARVAERGLLIGFLNRFSLYHLLNVRRSRGTMSHADMLTSFRVASMVRATGNRPTFSRSVLPGPLNTWKECAPWATLNNRLYPGWLGAFSAMRVDIAPHKPMTPLLLWKSDPNKRFKEASCGSSAVRWGS